MSIPFTQYKRPNGRTEEVTIGRSSEIEALAERFIKAGGCYEAEVLRTGDVSLTAVIGNADVEIEIVENGQSVPKAVDELVRRSVTHIK
jgi:hypothetical protein